MTERGVATSFFLKYGGAGAFFSRYEGSRDKALQMGGFKGFIRATRDNGMLAVGNRFFDEIDRADKSFRDIKIEQRLLEKAGDVVSGLIFLGIGLLGILGGPIASPFMTLEQMRKA